VWCSAVLGRNNAVHSIACWPADSWCLSIPCSSKRCSTQPTRPLSTTTTTTITTSSCCSTHLKAAVVGRGCACHRHNEGLRQLARPHVHQVHPNLQAGRRVSRATQPGCLSWDGLLLGMEWSGRQTHGQGQTTRLLGVRCMYMVRRLGSAACCSDGLVSRSRQHLACLHKHNISSRS
jgi:hypothetical protein